MESALKELSRKRRRIWFQKYKEGYEKLLRQKGYVNGKDGPTRIKTGEHIEE